MLAPPFLLPYGNNELSCLVEAGQSSHAGLMASFSCLSAPEEPL